MSSSNPCAITSISELNDLAETNELRGLFWVPIDLYHAGPGVSSTGLKEILKSPAHFKSLKAEERLDTTALRFGRLVHLRLLEPDVFTLTVAIEPKADGRTTAGKAIKAQFATDSIGKEIISEAEAEKLEAIAHAAKHNKLASNIFGKGLAELSVYWTDEETGVLCKARADLLHTGVIFDLKTCYSAQPKEFQKAIASYQYHLSAAFYLDGFQTVTEVKHFSWIALEKEAPYCFGFYAADQELLNAGRAEYQRALARYAECEKSGEWPGYEQAFVNITLNGV
jgi:hypothetical protein